MDQTESKKSKRLTSIIVVVAIVISVIIISVVVWKRVRYWVPQGKSPPMTRMMLAAWGGDREGVMKYIDKGKDVNEKTMIGTTALKCAVYGKHYDIAKLLLLNGANPNIGDFRENEIVIQLARNGEVEFLTYLFDYINTESDEYWMALVALLRSCDVQALETVLQSLGERSSWEPDYIHNSSHLGNDCVREMQSLADRFKE